MLKPEEESPFIPLPPLQPATVSTAIYNIRYSNFFIVFAYIWVQRYEKSIKAKINLAFSSLFCKFAGDMTYEALWKRLTPLYEAGEAKAIARWMLDVRFGLTMADILCGKVEELSEAAQAELKATLVTGTDSWV
jgi:hypothetical protein